MNSVESQGQGVHIENLYLRVQLNISRLVHDENDPPENKRWGLLNLHIHPYTELFFCESGSVEIKTENNLFSLLPGDILVIPAGVKHVRIPSSDENIRWNSICFSHIKRQTRGSQDLYGVFNRVLSKPVPLVVREHHELSTRLCRLVAAGENASHLSALSLADILASIIEIHRDNAQQQAKEPPSPRGDVDIDSIAHLEHLVACHYMEYVSTPEIAKNFHISARQLDRLSHRRYGVSFRRAVINRRLQVAVEMFNATRMTIEEIGLAVGFSSRLGFSRAFAAQHGISPQQYRKRYCGK